ncbi:formate dehydrogenase subunit gamma [Vibrio sp. SM6]|uniref:Formate dehydrogenase subunit gamma n=2 Tax=Vibrio agarilyticus TaxID=2726741 RepID=A0A7X8TPV8_9VIBR|nr:formate dehydrogenase subunit gamma [Vibrio agarilyticus]
MITIALSGTVLANDATPQDAENTTEVQEELYQAVGQDPYQRGTMGFWDQVRQGESGFTTSKGDEHDVLISTPGNTWYILKEKWMSPVGAVAIFGSITMMILFYIIVGPLMLSAPRTGKTILRWTRWDRALHWSMAFTFLTLAFSGLMLVYGKHFLKPYVPSEFWAFIMMLAKQYHNYIGPIFCILLIAVLFKWMSKSFFNKADLQWFLKLGGMVGKHKGTHPSADFSNGGEKALFWLLIICGALVSISGLVLDFPIFGQTRRDMEFSNLVHSLSALILICGFVFHIYIGLFGMEGALEGMVTGEVDETWAKEHHDIWYARVKAEQQRSTVDLDATNKGDSLNEQS